MSMGNAKVLPIPEGKMAAWSANPPPVPAPHPVHHHHGGGAGSDYLTSSPSTYLAQNSPSAYGSPSPHCGVSAAAMRRRPSMASFTSVMRSSPSVASIRALVEEPTRTSQPTKTIEHNTLRIPASVDHHALPLPLLAWAKSTRSNELASSARVLVTSSPGGACGTGVCHARLVMDDDEKMVGRSGDECFVFLQMMEFLSQTIPHTCDLFFVLHTNDVSYVSKPWRATDNPQRNNEAFLVPFAEQCRLSLFARFPITPGKKKGGGSLLGNLRRKTSVEHLQGSEIQIGDVCLDLNAVDFGKETLTLRLNPDHRLATVLNWSFETTPELTIRLGVWTGANVRARSHEQAFFQSYLTLQSNPKSPAWKRYWAVIDPEDGMLKLYDFEYKESKLHHVLSLATIGRVQLADPEEYPIPMTFQLMCRGTGTEGKGAKDHPHPPPLGQLKGGANPGKGPDGWRASTDTLTSVEPSNWVCRADSDGDLSLWMQSLTATVELAHRQAIKS